MGYPLSIHRVTGPAIQPWMEACLRRWLRKRGGAPAVQSRKTCLVWWKSRNYKEVKYPAKEGTIRQTNADMKRKNNAPKSFPIGSPNSKYWLT
jgi:hypothetical protein